MSEITYQQLALTHQQKDKLRDLAKSLGFTIGRGSEKDWGSINKLAQAIANGELRVTINNE